MSTEPLRKPWRCVVLSVVKHDYVARAFANHADFELVVVSEDDDQPDWVHARNREFATELGIPYEPHWERARQDYAPQVAIVSSETERHARLAVLAAEAGLHVVQDKPMASTLAECDAIVAAVARQRVQFLMWNRNEIPAIRQAREVVQSGRLGNLLAVHVDFYFAKDAGPPLGSVGPDHQPADWLESLKAAHATGADGSVGQRPMGEMECEGIYPLAYVLLLTGQRVERVFALATAHFHQLHADHHVDDLATLTLELTGGVRATICVGRIGNSSHPDLGEIKLHLIGTEGSYVVREASPQFAVDYRGQSPYDFRHTRLQNDSDWHLAENFAQALRTGSTTLLDAEQSRHIFATVAAAQRSAATRRVCRVS